MKETLKNLLSPILFLCLLAFLLVVIKLFATSGSDLLANNPRAMDFLAFYTGGAVLSHEGSSHLYDLSTQLTTQQKIAPITKHLDIFLPFLHPPFVAMLFLPLSTLPLIPAYIIWTSINACFLAIFCIVALKQLSHTTWYVKVAATGLIITFLPIANALLLGQLTLLLNIILLFAWIALKRGHQFRGGLLLSLLLIKPHFFLVPLLAIIVQRRIRLFLGMALGTCVLLFFSLLLVGWEGIRDYTSFLAVVANWEKGYGIDIKAQHSLQTALLNITGAQSIADIRMLWGIGAMIVLISTLFLWTKKYNFHSPRFSLQFILLILCSLIIAPHTHFYDLGMLTVVGVILLSILHKEKEHKRLFISLLIAEYLCMLLGFLLRVYIPQYNDLWIITSVGLLLLFWGTSAWSVHKKSTNKPINQSANQQSVTPKFIVRA